jgi:hypothetical protein
LAVDDLISDENFFGKGLRGGRLLLDQVGISSQSQKRPKKKGEKVTDPALQTPLFDSVH